VASCSDTGGRFHFSVRASFYNATRSELSSKLARAALLSDSPLLDELT
jgi:hypothetical protein